MSIMLDATMVDMLDIVQLQISSTASRCSGKKVGFIRTRGSTDQGGVLGQLERMRDLRWVIFGVHNSRMDAMQSLGMRGHREQI